MGLAEQARQSTALPVEIGFPAHHGVRPDTLCDAAMTATLTTIHGWDAWNVTEDADLGLGLARLGFRAAALSSTGEDAPSTPVAAPSL